jgi:mannose-6-phosphate isomerase-like protein (cupin superfamily)
MKSKPKHTAVPTVRPWGKFHGWDSGADWYLKTLYVSAGRRLSLQYHHHREECWLLVEGDATATVHTDSGVERKVVLKKGEVFTIQKGQIHRLESNKGGVVVEVAYGLFDEEDIIRLHDDYGRYSRTGALTKVRRSKKNR